MNTPELIDKARRHMVEEITFEQARDFYKCFINAMLDSLKRRDHIYLHGFGKFKVNHRKAKTFKFPFMEEAREITERDVVNFRMSENVKREINK